MVQHFVLTNIALLLFLEKFILFHFVKHIFLFQQNMNNIGEKIRKIRDLKGLSQENMADMLDLSLPTYADIERGKKDVTIGRLKQVAEKLGVTLNDIINFDERVAIFFDQCQDTNVNAGTNPIQNNNYDANALKHQVEKLQLELKLCQAQKDKDAQAFQHQVEKLQLELKLCQAQKDKAEMELQHYRQRGESRQ